MNDLRRSYKRQTADQQVISWLFFHYCNDRCCLSLIIIQYGYFFFLVQTEKKAFESTKVGTT